MARSSYQNFNSDREKEPCMIVLWNGGEPFIIDARRRFVVELLAIVPGATKEQILAWAAANKVRCVGFAGSIAYRKNATLKREPTWAAE